MAITRKVVVEYSYLLISMILIIDAIATILLLSMGYRVFEAPPANSLILAFFMLGLGIAYSVLFIRGYHNGTDIVPSAFSMALQLGVASLWIIIFIMDIPTLIKLMDTCLVLRP